MKQSVKNVIMLGMAAVLIGTSAVTISYAGTGARMQSRPEFSQNGGQRQSEAPFEGFENGQNETPDGNRGFRQQKGFGDNSQQMPDQKDVPQSPDQNGNGDGKAQPQTPDNSQGNSAQQTPDKQENGGETQNGNASQKNTSTSSELSLNTAAVGAPGNGAALPMRNSGRGFGVVSGLCYAFAAVQISIILAIIIYLILSKFNKISFNTLISNMRNNQ